MITYSGRYVWPEKGCPSLADIGRGLSRIPRFVGQTREFYSVLSHVEVVSMLLPDELKLDGLLHDAPEAVVSDTPTTWKSDYHKEMEAVILRRLYRELACKMPNKAAKILIKEADMAALSAEAFVLGHAEWDWFDAPTDTAVVLTQEMLMRQISVTEPEQAEQRYIKLIGLAHRVKQIA